MFSKSSRGPWGLSGYQWAVLFAAWLGWGFDIFDGLLFNYVAPNCVPTLCHVPIGSKEAAEVTIKWTGILTSVLLLGWAAGGIFFGWLADRIGRTKTLLATILLYSLGTSLCAAAPNMAVLTLCRIFTALGIGGEWAAGAAMVAEVVPEHKRVEAGALLYTAAPVGLVFTSIINQVVVGDWFKSSPETSWRWVFLVGLVPAMAAILMRFFLEEPETWAASQTDKPPTLGELFSPQYRHLTVSGLITAIVALLCWWSSNSFMPILSAGLAKDWADLHGVAADAVGPLKESWKSWGTYVFCLGGLIGTLATVPFSNKYGRKVMFKVYFALSALSLGFTFGINHEPQIRLAMYFPLGLFVFGVFGSFTYYLPELFPTRLRATGSGFCYNVGRVITSAGPAFVGYVGRAGHQAAMDVMLYITIIPILGLLAMPWVVETRDVPIEGASGIDIPTP